MKIPKHSSVTTSLNFLVTLRLILGVWVIKTVSHTRLFSKWSKRTSCFHYSHLLHRIRRPPGHAHQLIKIHPLICCLVIIPLSRRSFLGQLPFTNIPTVILWLHLNCFTEVMLRPRLKVRFAFCLNCFPVEQPESWLWGDPAGKPAERIAKNELSLDDIKRCVDFPCGWVAGLFTRSIHPYLPLQYSTQLTLGIGKVLHSLWEDV